MDKSKYYIIIPADVRYDRNLKANEKLIYGEIVLLAQKHGYCWATNAYFAELYGVTKVTVSNWLANLEKAGYVRLEYLYRDGEVVERRVYICDNDVSEAQEKLIEKEDSEDEYTKKKAFNKNVEEIVSYLNSKCGTNFKSNTSATKNLIKRRFKEGFNVDDFKTVIDLKYKDWGERPVRFSNGQMSNEYLRPMTLFGDKFESYVYEAITRKNSEGHKWFSDSVSIEVDPNSSGISF